MKLVLQARMPDSSETGETGGKRAIGKDRAHTSHESRSARLSRPPTLTLPHSMGEGEGGGPSNLDE